MSHRNTNLSRSRSQEQLELKECPFILLTGGLASAGRQFVSFCFKSAANTQEIPVYDNNAKFI